MTEYLCTVEDGDGVVVLAGEIDHSNAGAVEAALRESSADGALVVDVARVTFADSGAVYVILRLAAELRARGGAMRLVAPGGCAVARVLAITDPDGIAEIHATRDGALARDGR